MVRAWATVVASQRDRRAANAGALESYEGHLQWRALRCWRRDIARRLAQRRLLRQAVARLQGSKLFVRFRGWCTPAKILTWSNPQPNNIDDSIALCIAAACNCMSPADQTCCDD
jgi:hypothetical protein